jgi:hypothetical protein
MDRGKVLYTVGWVLGYVIACVFHLYVTKDSGFTREEHIHHLKSLGIVYILACLLSLVLFSEVFYNFFEKDKMGWFKRALWSLAVVGFLIVHLVKFFGVSFFPFDFFGHDLFFILFWVFAFILIPVVVGLFIVVVFIEVLGIEVS